MIKLFEPKHNLIGTKNIDIYELAKRALEELAKRSSFLRGFRTSPVERSHFEIDHLSGNKISLQVLRESEACLGRYRRFKSEVIARIVLRGSESIEKIMSEIVRTVNKAIHRLKKAARREIQRSKSHFDARFCRFDRCCMVH